ncbi:cation-translocating P-type ATPase [Emcibacter nanhaiensis]|uniref:Cation-transporting P-type ATPase n=1 Tax=Emcibacter nanhaiensis TaxID=1505037 RepID=A0A501PN54_9PROT|nr:cation-transporting P-type ATPase [Emcibacter nanhaiensis]TPD61725.1 cation-transporting P-type ATPase [Emcibacter nanhaiensis]
MADAESKKLNARGALVWRKMSLEKMQAIAEAYPPKEEIDLEGPADLFTTLPEDGIVMSRVSNDSRILPRQVLFYRDYIKRTFSQLISTQDFATSRPMELITPSADAPPTPSWHCISEQEVLAFLQTDEGGLSGQQVAVLRAKWGANRLPEGKEKKLWQIVLNQFLNPLIYLLLIAAVLAWLIGERVDSYFIFGVLAFNAVVGTFQEWRAEKSARALQKFMRTMVQVHRDGHWQAVDSTELVPGDIVKLEAGQKIAADLRILEGRELTANESLLTGESTPVHKKVARDLPADLVLADRENMLHAGSELEAGSGMAVVVSTGMQTALGNIAEALSTEDVSRPPLILRMERFSNRLMLFTVVLMAVLSIYLYLQGHSAVSIFMLVVALAVAAVPEGLPVAVTVALAAGMHRMARKNVIVRQMPAAEGLGACSMIFSDKTGTMTQNKLVVQAVRLADGEQFTLGEKPLSPRARIALWRAGAVAALCNETSDDGDELAGDSVDIAFIHFARTVGVRQKKLLHHFASLSLIPFDARRRYAASFHKFHDRTLAAVKGAPEALAPLCRGDTSGWLAEAERMAADGYRVLALAGGEVQYTDETFLRDLEFIGLVGLIDPVRPEVPAAVARCKEAGVKVCMITGDHPATALAICREIGLASDISEVVTGREIAALAENPEALRAKVREARVFARVEPLQKRQIIQAAMAEGHFVAVTGDGVNDAPALKDANIGVAMGKGGTDMARNAADLIITDDNFASIVDGIEEGRVAYSNVRKLIYLLITTGLGEIVLVLLSLAMGLPLPLTAIQLLWLNLVSNGIQDVALAIEKGEPGLMSRPPRPASEGIFNRRMIRQITVHGLYIGAAACGVFWFSLTHLGLTEFDARNLTLLVMIMFENAHVFNARSETRSVFRIPFSANWWVIGAVFATQALHTTAMHIPLAQQILDIGPVSPATWFELLGMALGLILLNEIFKLIYRRE